MDSTSCPNCGQFLTAEETSVGCPRCALAAVLDDGSIGGRPDRTGDAGLAKEPGSDTTGRHIEFQTTDWSLLQIAVQSDSPRAREAMEKLCGNYWYPVYAFIRRRGYPPDQACDFTQELFYRLLKKRSFAAVNPSRGRFRAFLRTCAQNLLNQKWQREHALKRGGNYSFVAFDEVLGEARYASDAAHSLSPDRLFERRWVMTILARAMDRLKNEYVEKDKLDQFEAFHVFLSGPKDAPSTYAEAGSRFGMSECAARQAAHRLRDRLGDLIRIEVAQTVTSPAELEAEIRHLRTVLSG